MSAAVDYLASMRILHNDIRPANIIYNPGQGAILLDFGSASEQDEPYGNTRPEYVCPEYIRSGERGVGSDVFSFGVVMLFVTRQIRLPESFVAPGWSAVIAAEDTHSVDSGLARDWLTFVEIVRTRMSRYSGINSIVFRMLEPEPRSRISIQELARIA